MARGTLHSPKPEDRRRRTNAPTHGERVVVDDGELRGPGLVEATGRDGWHPQTLAWYRVWRLAPQAALFEATDWSRLALLAAAVDRYHENPSAAMLSEIRLNEERLGATYVDRMRARIRVERDEPTGNGETEGNVVNFPARQSLADRMRS